MFRISFEERPNDLTMRIEGRFVGSFAEETIQLLATRNISSNLVVDLSEVTFADSAGEAALHWLKRIGATFIAESSYARHLCERLQLALLGEPARTHPIAPMEVRTAHRSHTVH